MKNIYEALKYTPTEVELEEMLNEAVEQYSYALRHYDKIPALSKALETVVDLLDHTDNTYCTVRFNNGYLELPELVIEHEDEGITDILDLKPALKLIRKQYDKQTKELRP